MTFQTEGTIKTMGGNDNFWYWHTAPSFFNIKILHHIQLQILSKEESDIILFHTDSYGGKNKIKWAVSKYEWTKTTRRSFIEH